jgi:hypothetical protein
MVEVHLALGIALLVTNLVAGVWGGVAWLRREPSIRFWYALRIAQTAVILQVLLGMLLVFTGHSTDELHILYGALPLLVSFLAELARAGAASQELGELDFHSVPEERQREIGLTIVRREMGIMAVACLVIFFLALRAAGTSTVF